MASTTASRVVLGAVLAALMVLSAVEMCDASLRIFWRFAVLSFDNPVTQLQDELVCESSPTSQAGAEALRSARLAVLAWRPLATVAAPPCGRIDALLFGITRAPPAA
jgi:hypothetical protein